MTDAMPTPIEVQHWTELDLADGGRILIEASAGTGKTWTIAVLYLRLLLQRRLSPRQIVVATFTEPAAQELRERIRQRVQQALRWASAPGETVDEDEALAWLRTRWAGEASPGKDWQALQLAVSELDGAPIGTLHSLCQRILSDYPFETGSQFVSGELVSGDSMLAECARDLLRNLAVGDATSPPPALKELSKRLNVLFRPSVSVRTQDPSEARRDFPANAAALLRALAAEKSIFTLTEGTGVPTKTLSNALTSLVAWVEDESLSISVTHWKSLLAKESLVLAESLPHLEQREDWRLVDQAMDAYESVQNSGQLQEWGRERVLAMQWRDERLAARNQLTFDSLLTRANAAIERNPILANQLLEAWPVALVDEFQDTDALQYGVLDRIYQHGDGGSRGLLVMIGDPKQAIYGFRGGDIDTYERAAGSAGQRLALDVNRRADPRLVAATNAFYSLCGSDLSARSPHAIQYRPVRDADPAPRYLVDGQVVQAPLQLHYRGSNDLAGQPARKAASLEACANQIAEMLGSGRHMLEGAPLRPGHIAVLLPTAGDIASLRSLLIERGVPCVGSGKSNVFDSEWASELQLLLHAARHPHSAPAVRAALATRLMGLDFGALQALQVDASAFSQQVQVFEDLQRRWHEAGVLAVIRDVIARATPRLLATPEGERWLTDLRHLGELIQDAEMELHGPEQLLAWLASERSGANGPEESERRQLRMESDAHRVRLMTLHASKGLEFPVVFLPMMWNHAHMPTLDTINLIADPDGGRRVAFGSKAQRAYRQSGQDERFRVLYVALTRAKHACHVYVMDPERPANARTKSPLADPERSALDASIERLRRATVDGASWPSALGWSEGWPWQHTGPLDFPDEPFSREVRPMPASPVANERMHSFSSLRNGRALRVVETAASDEVLAGEAGVPDEDADDEFSAASPSSEPASPDLAELAFVAGAEFGNALHQVFEKRRVGQPMSAQLALVDESLRDFGVRLGDLPRAESVARIGRRIQAALDADVGGGLRLGELPARALRAEMGFYYPLRGTSVSALRNACEAHGIRFPQGPLSVLEGLMHGKIDLVFEHAGRFHVLDYKGNRLGDRASGGTLADYAPGALGRVMKEENYDLQALLYTVALDRFLRQRVRGYDRDVHLGETIYLFVRAAGLAPGAGVWRHRFDDRLLDAVDEALAGNADRLEPLQVIA